MIHQDMLTRQSTLYHLDVFINIYLVTRHGVWFGNQIIGHLKLITTSNYRAIANSHNL
jgi:hypothetical protein